MFWGASEKRVAIVKTRKDESADEGFGGSDCKIVVKGADLAYGRVCRATDVRDVVVEGQVIRENVAEISR